MFNISGLFSPFFITLFGGILLLGSSGKEYRNRFYLALFFFSGLGLFTSHVFTFLGYYQLNRIIDFAFLGALLSFYPFYYLYLYSAFGYNMMRVKWKYHFALSVIYALVMFVATWVFSAEDYNIYMQHMVYKSPLTTPGAKTLSIIYNSATTIHIAQIIYYNIISLLYMLRTRRDMNNCFSNLDKFQLRHFFVANVSFLVFMGIPGIYAVYVGRQSFADDSVSLGAFGYTFTILFIVLAVVGIRQVPFSANERVDQEEDKPLEGSKETADPKKENLLHYFENDKPYLNSDLNIWEVSRALFSNRTYISNLINREFDCNFNQFVNQYRIEEAKHLLSQKANKNISIDNIAVHAGFGSLSSFTRVFKQIVGETPNRYRLSCRNVK